MELCAAAGTGDVKNREFAKDLRKKVLGQG
jgi:hypothetical protein